MIVLHRTHLNLVFFVRKDRAERDLGGAKTKAVAAFFCLLKRGSIVRFNNNGAGWSYLSDGRKFKCRGNPLRRNFKELAVLSNAVIVKRIVDQLFYKVTVCNLRCKKAFKRKWDARGVQRPNPTQ